MNSPGDPESRIQTGKSAEFRQDPPVEETPAAGVVGRQRIMDLDRTPCRTRLSHRRFLIRMQADVVSARSLGAVRNSGDSDSGTQFGRQVDWD